MQVTILGCGTSTGVPVIHCTCAVCTSPLPENNRTRASIFVTFHGKHFLIDTATDLRAQALRHNIPHIDAVLFTHPHADHIGGLDELRSFNFSQKKRIPLFGNHWSATEIPTRFAYIFKNTLNEGGGIPLLDFTEIKDPSQPLYIQDVEITPLPVKHGSQDCLGYRFGSLAYITDCSFIPNETLDKMQDLDLLILDCLRLLPHPTHFNLEQSLAVVNSVHPKKTILTHLGHEFDYARERILLPENVYFAYDGMRENFSAVYSSLHNTVNPLP